MTKKILYISYNAITEPLVRSQVLNYLEGLANLGYQFELLTFEKHRLAKEQEAELRNELIQKSIDWHPLTYHQLQLLGTALDIWNGSRLAVKLAREKQVKLVHARSFIPALIARNVKRKLNIPFLNDIRGFWVDEKAYKGSIDPSSPLFRLFKRWERTVYQASDAIVSLSDIGITEIKNWNLWGQQNRPPMVTIPTCVDLDAFDVQAFINTETPIFGYVGSMGRGYLGHEVFRFFKAAQAVFPESRLLIVSRTDRKLLEQWGKDMGTCNEKVEILSVEPDEIPAQIARMDVGLSFIEPHYSKKASCPTKLGEYLAAGVPVIANSGIGDTDTILSQSATGIVFDDFSERIIGHVLKTLPDFLNDDTLPKRCRAVADKYFSLKHGVSKYSHIYSRLLEK